MIKNKVKKTDDDKKILENDVYVIRKNKWKDIRNKDFYTFISCLKKLPRIDEAMQDDEIKKYFEDVEITLKNTNIIQRDLLGKTTEFEKAFVYLKYDFKIMAFFSMFIAMFFDLGAFLTGCFLYCTEFFHKSKI